MPPWARYLVAACATDETFYALHVLGYASEKMYSIGVARPLGSPSKGDQQAMKPKQTSLAATTSSAIVTAKQTRAQTSASGTRKLRYCGGKLFEYFLQSHSTERRVNNRNCSDLMALF
jgi:hypothetical protein